MTESEWWSATDFRSLTDWLFFDAIAADRKLRLFTVRCCREVLPLIRAPDLLHLFWMTEAVADGRVRESELQEAVQAGWKRYVALSTARPLPSREVVHAHAAVLHAATERDNLRSQQEYQSHENFAYPTWVAVLVGQAIGNTPESPIRLLHDIFGPLPFRDIAVQPAWLTSDVRLLAQGIYDAKAFDRMPILADALQDAGCDNAEILNHCRAVGWEHVRGCWVIDLLLGKPWKESPRPQ